MVKRLDNGEQEEPSNLVFIDRTGRDEPMIVVADKLEEAIPRLVEKFGPISIIVFTNDKEEHVMLGPDLLTKEGRRKAVGYLVLLAEQLMARD